MVECFKPIKSFLQITGGYIPKHRRGYRRALQWIYCIVLQMILISNTARPVSWFLLADGLSGSLMLSLAYFAINCSVTYNSFLYLFASTKHMDNFLVEFAAYLETFGHAFNVSKLRLFIMVGCFGSFAYGQLQGVSALLLMYADGAQNSTLHRLTSPMNTWHGVAKVFGTVYIYVGNSLFGMYQGLSFILFSGTCYCFHKTFDDITAGVERMIENDSVVEKCESIRQQHVKLCGILEKGNILITHYLFSTYAFLMPTVCFVLYGLVRSDFDLNELFVAVGTGFGGVFFCFYATFVAARICEKVCLTSRL